MRGRLAAIYSIDPQADTYADHSGAAPGDFAVFERQQPVPHRLYLGHAELFNLAGAAEIVLTFSFGAVRRIGAPGTAAAAAARLGVPERRRLAAARAVEDGTARFTRDGKITLGEGSRTGQQERHRRRHRELLDSRHRFAPRAVRAHRDRATWLPDPLCPVAAHRSHPIPLPDIENRR